MADSASERLTLELELLTSMYPDTLHFSEKIRELTFTREANSKDKLVLRLGPDYPNTTTPEVISARNTHGSDLRQQIQALVKDVCTEINAMDPSNPGEVLDAVIARYVEVLDAEGFVQESQADTKPTNKRDFPPAHKTVIIWLHHLLATSKRKLAIHPTISPGQVCGVTKPGYPGVMVFSGARSAVEEHVAELKAQNWQAFAVRYESDELWEFGGVEGGGGGVREVETMAEAVQCVEEGRREEFLRAVGVK